MAARWMKVGISLIGIYAWIALPSIASAAKDNSDSFQPVTVKREIEPFYPNWAYNNGIGEGFAKVAFYVDESGIPSDYLVIEYSHEAFADSFMDALPHWKFEPAHEFGKPVKSVCRAYWEFLPDRAIVTNALFDTSKRIQRKDAHNYRELKTYNERKLDSKLNMVAFPEIVAPKGFDSSQLEGDKVKVICHFYVDTEGVVALPSIIESSVPSLNERLANGFAQAVFDRPLFKKKPAIAWMEKTYLINVTVP